MQSHNSTGAKFQINRMNKSIKNGVCQNFLKFCISLCIIISDQVKLPKLFIKIFIVAKYGYLIHFIFEQIVSECAPITDPFMDLILKIVTFFRNFHYIPVTDTYFKSYSFIIVVFFQAITGIYFMVSYFNYMQERKSQSKLTLSQFLTHQRLGPRIIMFLIALGQETFDVYLFYRLFDFGWLSFSHSISKLRDDKTYIVLTLISLVVIIILGINSLFRINLHQSLTMNTNNFNTLYSNGIDIINVIMNLLYIAVNLSINNSLGKFYLSLAFLFLSCLCRLNTIFNLCIVQSNIIEYKLIGESFLISGTIVSLFIHIAGNNSIKNFAIICLLFTLLTYKVLITLWEQKVFRLQIERDNKKHPKYIQFVISNTLSQKQTQQTQICDYIFLQNHHLTCVKVKCPCQKKRYNHDNLFSLQKQTLAEEFNSSLYAFRTAYNINIFHLHYISTLNQFGLTSQAFHQSTVLLYKNRKQNDSGQSIPSKRESEIAKYPFFTSQIVSVNEDKTIEIKANYIHNQTHHILHDFSMIEKVKLQMLQEQIKTQMNQTFLVNATKSNMNSEDLSHSVNLFIQAEIANDSIKHNVLKNFQRKIQFLQVLGKTVQVSSQDIFNRSKRLSVKLLVLEESLFKLYETFPSQKIQSVNAFVQSELLNNFFMAYKITNLTTIADEKLLKMHQNMQINLFSSNVSYMIVGFEDNAAEMKILKPSTMLHTIFGYTREEFQSIQTIKPLIPKGIRQAHQQHVSVFMMDGQSRFFRDININFIQLRSGFIKPIKFFYDLNFTNLNDMNFICFFLEHKSNNSYIVVNTEKVVTTMSFNLYHMMGTQISFKMPQLTYLLLTQIFGIKVDKIIPDFKKMQDQLKGKFSGHTSGIQPHKDQDSRTQRFFNIEIIFLNDFCIDQLLKQDTKIIVPITTIHALWNKVSNLRSFSATLTIYEKYRADFTYTIVEIEQLKEYGNPKAFNQSTRQQSQQLLVKNDSWSEYFEGSQFNIDDEQAPNYPNALQLSELREKLVPQQDESAARDVPSNMLLTNHLLKIENRQDQRYAIDNPITSPCQTERKMLSDDIHQKRNIQQKFYMNKFELQSESFQEEEQSYKQNKQMRQLDKVSSNQEVREQIMLQVKVQKQEEQKIIQIDDAASQVSSLAIFRKSKFFKKYETIHRILLSKQKPSQLPILMILQTLYILTFITLIMLVLVNSGIDLQRFLEEIDMLSIKANIIGPVQKFILSQYAWVAYYLDALLFRVITIEEGMKLAEFPVYTINQTYGSLKHDFESQLTNPYLEEFFTDEYITIGQYDQNIGISYRNITFRSSILLWFGFLYDFTVLMHFEKFFVIIDANQTFIVYTYVNYLTFIERFDLLEDQILDYTLHRTEQVQSKWTIMVIPFLIINIVLVLIMFIFYRAYIQNYEKIMNLYRLIEKDSLQKDLVRYAIIQELLNKDGNIMFKYQFDLDQKERFLSSEEIKKESIQKQQVVGYKKKGSESLNIIQPKIPALILLLIMYSVFLAYALLIVSLTNSFLTAYLPTAEFYKQISDTNVAVCGAFAKREIVYATDANMFFYYNASTKVALMDSFQKDIVTLNQFQVAMSEFPSKHGRYLVSKNFSTQFMNLTTHNICQALDEDYYRKSGNLCQVSLKGVALRGLLPTLNLMMSMLTTEQQSNNFTTRSQYPFQEMELPIITSEVLTLLMKELKSGLQDITQELIDSIGIICIVFLVYCFLQFVFCFTFVRSFYSREFNIVKRYLLLVPQNTIFLEMHFERAIRLMIAQDNLI